MLLRLDSLAVDEHGSRVIVQSVCRDFEIVEPQLAFHARRSPYTGQTEAPPKVERAPSVSNWESMPMSMANVQALKELPLTSVIYYGGDF
ncbi:MAG: hypothetical protein IIB38_17110 [Candidatus Hydrogenedentes bacterium]|nr:hypothetical protein [Candidatus Hydrogenedentota bacterium]